MKDVRRWETVDSARSWGRRFVGLAALGVLILLVAACERQQASRAPTQPAPGTVPAPTAIVRGKAATRTPAPAPSPTPTPTPPAPLAAQVNGEYIFWADYEQQLAQYEQALLEAGLDAETEEGQAALDQARRDVLEEMIDALLIEQGAKDLGLTLSDADLAARIAADIEAGGGEAAFTEWLSATGTTRQGYEQMVRQAMVAQAVWEAVTADVPDTAEQVHVRHIVVGSREEADRVLTRLRGGDDWAVLVNEVSLDSATRENGGDLGWFPRGVVAPEIEAAAFGLPLGGVSEPVPLQGQFHILLLVEREAERRLSPEMVVQLRQARFDRWLAGRRAEAEIERFVAK